MEICAEKSENERFGMLEAEIIRDSQRFGEAGSAEGGRWSAIAKLREATAYLA